MSTESTRSGMEPATEEELRRTIAGYEARMTEIADLVAHVRHEIRLNYCFVPAWTSAL
jgi:hypothetical protein